LVMLGVFAKKPECHASPAAKSGFVKGVFGRAPRWPPPKSGCFFEEHRPVPKNVRHCRPNPGTPSRRTPPGARECAEPPPKSGHPLAKNTPVPENVRNRRPNPGTPPAKNTPGARECAEPPPTSGHPPAKNTTPVPKNVRHRRPNPGTPLQRTPPGAKRGDSRCDGSCLEEALTEMNWGESGELHRAVQHRPPGGFCIPRFSVLHRMRPWRSRRASQTFAPQGGGLSDCARQEAASCLVGPAWGRTQLARTVERFMDNQATKTLSLAGGLLQAGQGW